MSHNTGYKMKIGIKVGDIMTRNYISISPNTSVKECTKMMIKKRVGSLILEEEGKLKGLITERDIIWAMTKKPIKDFGNITAGAVAKKKVVTIKPSADLFEALQKMKKAKYRWLPVVFDGNLIGFLTLKDILRVEPSLFEIVHSHGAFQIKEEQEKLSRRAGRRAGIETWIKEGVCDECENFDLLYDMDGRHICENCRDEL